MKANVSIMRCNSYSMDILIPVIENVISTSDFPEVNGRTVFVKPNILSDSKPESCITTNPEFLRAFIRILKKRGAASVLVGDSPGLPAPSFAAMGCGIGQVCKEEGAKWIDIGSDNIIVAIPFTKQRLPVAAAVSTSDLVISLPKFKTHQLMYFTGGVKNLFGVIPGLHKSPCHLAFPTREAFANFICGLYSYVKPDYCLMDGIIGMEGPGPANGTPRAVGLVLGSSDCGALDYSEATIMGYKPNSTPLIRALKAKGLFPEGISYPLLSAGELVISDFKRISITEKTKFVRTLIIPFFTRGIQKRRQMKEPAPEFLTDVCIRCRRCIEICPGNALEMKNGKVERSLSRCIRCYCCHEVCPADAIVIPKITKR